MPKILISYRRSDTAGVAGRIFDRLVARYGNDSIFMDVDHIPFGTDFREHIHDTLLSGDLLIAIVGPRWLGPRPEGRSRMHDENDPVRVEIETALRQGLALIPVLVDGAIMPTPDELPEALEKFSYLNAAPVDLGRDFHQHMDRLVRSIDRILEAKTAKAKPAADGPAATTTPAPTVAAATAAAPVPSAASSGVPLKWLAVGGATMIVGLLLFFFAPWTALQPGANQPPPPSGPPIRIGMGMVMSGPGAEIGIGAVLAAKIWQEDVNARGGLLGRPVELIVRDDEGKPSNVAGIYTRLIDTDKADLVVSGWPHFLIVSALPTVMQKNKLFLGLLGTGANDEFNYPRYFSISPTGPSRSPASVRGFLDLALAQNPKPRLAAISAADDQPCDAVTADARALLKSAGLPVVYDRAYAFTTTDFAPIIRAIAPTNPDILLTCSFAGDAAAYVRAVAEAGFKPKMIGGAMPSLRSVAIKAELGPLLNGWVNFELWLPVPKMQFAGVNDMIRKYQVRARDEGAEPIGHQVAVWSYARMQVLQQAVEATKSLDDTRLADYIRTAAFKTVVGDIKFGDKGEWAESRILQVQFQNIKGNSIEQFRDAATQVVVDPPAYKSGNLIYPFADARR